jgi:hypothetical protein
LLYYVALWYILWLFGIFFPFWTIVPRQIWQPCFRINCPKIWVSEADWRGLYFYVGTRTPLLECFQFYGHSI